MTNEVAIHNLFVLKLRSKILSDKEAIALAIKALEQQPCEDCISRQEALRHRHIVYDDDGIGYSVVRVDEIMALPPVTPQAEIEKEEPAEWIVNTDETRRWDRVRFYCSSCNSWNTYGKSKYCPNCGRRMQSEEH